MWSDFKKDLARLIAKKRVVLMGVGNPGCGDDAFGPLLADRLGSFGDFWAMNCEELPENYTGAVKEHHPDVVLIADAVNFGGDPGQVMLSSSAALRNDHLQTADGSGCRLISSHKPSLKLVMDYLSIETSANVVLLGVQPCSLHYGHKPTTTILQTIVDLEHLINRIRLKPDLSHLLIQEG